MERKECKNCTKFIGNCGYHHIDSDGHINYNLPKMEFADIYNNCKFYEEARTMKELCLFYLDLVIIPDKYKNAIVEVINEHME